MYILPQPYECPKCGHTEQYTLDNSNHWVNAKNRPYCPVCVRKFFDEHVGAMECTIDFTRKAK